MINLFIYAKHLVTCKSRGLSGLFMITLTLLTFTAGQSTVYAHEDHTHGDYLEHPKFKQLLKDMKQKVSEDKKPYYSEEQLIKTFSEVKQLPKVLESIARPAEKTKTWAEYRPIFITDKQIKNGIVFWQKHRNTFKKAEDTFNVPEEIILAIIGVETRYGLYKGRDLVLASLATLSFDYPPRSDFFYNELIEFLILCKKNNWDPTKIKGSYAGAMGYPQFISSSYRAYAVDFDNDNIVDLIDNPTDAIGSVANYFKKHKWKFGEPVVLEAKKISASESQPSKGWFNASLEPRFTLDEIEKNGLVTKTKLPKKTLAAPFLYEGKDGDEYWLGLHNFYVITRYNRSRLYAMAVYQLSLELAKEMNKTPTASAP